MIRVCAIISTFNEGDVILEVTQKLIASGVDVFVIDNGSTDDTVNILSPLVGKGIVDIECVRFYEDAREVFDWTSILKLKENIAKKIRYDWYLHVDADEIRYSPWPQYSLREGMDKVDFEGYNLINFKLFNFRLTGQESDEGDCENKMQFYSSVENYNQYQIKAWKSHQDVDIVGFGGHIIRRPDPRIYPIRFIHKHYPVRSLEHGRRKIIQERKNRFTLAEKSKGWHVQYDNLLGVNESDVYWSIDKLEKFHYQSECFDLVCEGASVLTNLHSNISVDVLNKCIKNSLSSRFVMDKFPESHFDKLYDISKFLISNLGRNNLPAIESTEADINFLKTAISVMAAEEFIKGDVSKFANLDSLVLSVIDR